MKSKTWIAGITVAVIAGGAILSGLTVHSASGAGTDVAVATATPTTAAATPTTTVAAPTPTSVAGLPPQSVIEPPAAPVTNPAGAPAGVNAGPAGLPSTGVATSSSHGGIAGIATLFGVFGVLLLGAGASIIARRRS